MARTVTPLRLAIVASGRTQRDIATAAGTDEYRLSRIVNGRELPGTDLCIAIADALGREVDELWPSHGNESDQAPADLNYGRLGEAA